jgi:RimJ/RimL family protein N-acetyltransferase
MTSLKAKIPEVETDRLLMRAWRGEDVEPMTAINSDPEVAPWLGAIDPSRTKERITAWLNHWSRFKFGLWAVEERESGKFIGRVGLMRHDDWTASAHDAEVGWTLAQSAWGRGYATEAARAALGWAQARPQLNAIISITKPDNVRSRRVMEKLGLAYAGTTTWRGFEQVWYATQLAA